MGRNTLRLLMVLGALVTALGGTGIFAVFSDSATGGTNSAVSGSRLSAADIVIAPATLTSGNVVCGTFGEDTTTPQITVTGLQPSSALTVGYVCIRNNGAAALALTAAASGIRDIDSSCTGDEEASGDTTCGGNLDGELSPALNAHVDLVACAGGSILSGRQSRLADLATSPLSIGTSPLGPGAPACVRLAIEYPSTTPEATIQVAQSDTVTWNYLIEGTAP